MRIRIVVEVRADVDAVSAEAAEVAIYKALRSSGVLHRVSVHYVDSGQVEKPRG